MWPRIYKNIDLNIKYQIDLILLAKVLCPNLCTSEYLVELFPFVLSAVSITATTEAALVRGRYHGWGEVVHVHKATTANVVAGLSKQMAGPQQQFNVQTG